MKENKAHRTAISRKKISAPMNFISWQIEDCRGRKLDYGCGRGFDADEFGMEKYDPHFFPERPQGKFDLITCNYVLCVVEEKDQQAIIDDIMSLLNPGGIVLLSVRRDQKKFGWTSRDTYQRFVELDWDVRHEEKGRYIIYKKTQREGMVAKTIKFSIVAQDARIAGHKFAEEMDAGVLVEQEATFYLTPKEAEHDGDYMFAQQIVDFERKFLENHVMVEMEELTTNND